MALHFRDPEVDRLARTLAARTGHSLTAVVREALEEKLERLQACPDQRCLKDEIMEISRRASALPRRSRRTPEDIIGYDEHGLPR